jgi:hypothetical protein
MEAFDLITRRQIDSDNPSFLDSLGWVITNSANIAKPKNICFKRRRSISVGGD